MQVTCPLPMVARVQLHNMHQHGNKTIRTFGFHVHAQASICKFLVKYSGCDTEVNYRENILHNVLTCALADNKIQLDLLGDKSQDMTLQEEFQFAEAKEAGKRSAGHLLQTQGADAAFSQNHSAQQDEMKNRKVTNNEHCSYCGKRGHGMSAQIKIRRNTYPHLWHNL